MAIDKLYKLEEAAEILRIEPKTLSNKISAREITVIKGRPVLISEAALQEYLKKKTKRAII